MLLAVDMAAQSSFCGFLPPNQASSTDLGEVYFDRFGNSYDLNSSGNNAANPGAGANGGECFDPDASFTTVNIGYYELHIYDIVPVEYLTVINNVTTYFTSIITQNNLCAGSEADPVIIQVLACDLEDPSIIAAGSPFYILENNSSECPNGEFSRLTSVMEATIKTGQNLFGTPAGCIVFNTETVANIYTGTGTLPFGMSDLTNIFMHEFMHALGFASVYANALPLSSFNFLTTFDLQMGLVSDYNGTGSQMANQLFSPVNCSGNNHCIEAALNPVDLEDLVNNNCAAGNQTIVLGDGIAPISGGTTATTNEFLNAMSHIANNCDNTGTNQFVMTPGDDDTRVLSGNELDILRSLGYEVNGEQDCYLIGNNEFNYDNYENSCCPNLFQDFTGCFGESILININDLLCNDLTNDANGLQLIGDPVFSSNLIDGEINLDNDLLTININEIPPTNPILINYNISACECVTLERSFQLNLIFCNDCTDIDECDNLICNDIQGLPAISGAGFGLNEIFYILDGRADNSVDFVTTTDNRTLHRLASGGHVESLCFPINGGIEPGCRMDMHIDAYGVRGNHLLNIFGSEFQPCHYTDTHINQGGIPTDWMAILLIQ